MKNENYHAYILLTYTGSMLSSIIRRAGDMPYSHISIGFDESHQTFYSFGRKYHSNPFFAGFVEEDVKNGVYQRFQEAQFALYEIEVTKKQYHELKRQIRTFERNKKLYRYNLLGMAFAKVGVSLSRNNAYFCSQFVATVFRRAGIHSFDRSDGLISPMDFLEIDGMRLLGQGRLSDFRLEQWGETRRHRRLREIPVSLFNRVFN
jgi:hypothetical protein